MLAMKVVIVTAPVSLLADRLVVCGFVFVVNGGIYKREGDDFVIVVQAHNTHTLGRPAELGYILEAQANGLALARYNNHFLGFVATQRLHSDEFAGLVVDHGRADTDAAAGMRRKLCDLGSF